MDPNFLIAEVGARLPDEQAAEVVPALRSVVQRDKITMITHPSAHGRVVYSNVPVTSDQLATRAVLTPEQREAAKRAMIDVFCSYRGTHPSH